MATASKVVSIVGPAIEPDLKEFIDEVLVPMLVRDAVQEIKNQIHIAPATMTVAQSASERGRS